MEGLEHEPDFLPTDPRQVPFGAAVQPFPVQEDFTGGGAVQPGEQGQQGGFARPGSAEDRDELPGGDVHIEPGENVQGTTRRGIAFSKPARAEQRSRHELSDPPGFP